MCQSKAEGGRRCSYHLEQAVNSAMTTYTVAVTGLDPARTKTVHEDLVREGKNVPDPTREEVDEFLHHQAFQVRHNPDLTEARRETILNRIRAAIGRITPDGATFHAWKNIVAEAWSRVRRKAATAFMVGALTFGVGACGNAPAQYDADGPAAAPVAAAPTTPGPTAAPVVEDYTKPGKVAVPDDVAREFGHKQATAAYQTAVTIIENETFRDDLLVDDEGNRTMADFAPIKEYMTPSMAKDWDRVVRADLANDNDFNGDVQAITFHDVEEGWTFRADGPKVIDKKITKPRVVNNGDGRLRVSADTQGTLRIVENDKPLLMTVTKSQTYYMKPVTKGGETTWLLDGYKGTFQVDKAVPDPAAAQPAA